MDLIMKRTTQMTLNINLAKQNLFLRTKKNCMYSVKADTQRAVHFRLDIGCSRV